MMACASPPGHWTMRQFNLAEPVVPAVLEREQERAFSDARYQVAIGRAPGPLQRFRQLVPVGPLAPTSGGSPPLVSATRYHVIAEAYSGGTPARTWSAGTAGAPSGAVEANESRYCDSCAASGRSDSRIPAHARRAPTGQTHRSEPTNAASRDHNIETSRVNRPAGETRLLIKNCEALVPHRPPNPAIACFSGARTKSTIRSPV